MSESSVLKQFSMVVDPRLASRRRKLRLRTHLPSVLMMLGIAASLAACGWYLRSGIAVVAGAFILVPIFSLVARITWIEPRSLRVTLPVGSRMTVSYAADHLVVGEPMLEACTPYAAIVAVRPGPDFVKVIRNRGLDFLLPVEVCPPDVAAHLSATVGSSAPPAVPTNFTRATRTTDAYAKAIAASATRRAMLHPVVIALQLAVLLAGIVALAQGDWSGALLIVTTLAFVVLFPVVMLRSWQAQAGIEIQSRFDDDGFLVWDQDGALKRKYELCDKVKVHPLAVELHWRSGAWSQHPRELVPDTELGRFTRAGARFS